MKFWPKMGLLTEKKAPEICVSLVLRFWPADGSHGATDQIQWWSKTWDNKLSDDSGRILKPFQKLAVQAAKPKDTPINP